MCHCRVIYHDLFCQFQHCYGSVRCRGQNIPTTARECSQRCDLLKHTRIAVAFVKASRYEEQCLINVAAQPFLAPRFLTIKFSKLIKLLTHFIVTNTYPDFSAECIRTYSVFLRSHFQISVRKPPVSTDVFIVFSNANKTMGKCIKLVYDRFLSQPFQFIIYGIV
jgi:hypothetical protein